MNTTDTLQSTSRAREYLDIWVQLISESLSSLLGTTVSAETVAGEDAPENLGEESDAGVWICFAADRAAEQAFFLDGHAALELAEILGAGQRVADGTHSPVNPKDVEEFFTRVATKIPLEDWLGLEMELKISESSQPEWESACEAAFRFTTPDGHQLLLHARISTELATALQSAQETDRKGPHPAIRSLPLPVVAEAPRDQRLELLMDVELDVVLRFGQREMLLRDVLTLTPGTVLELDQQVQDPVELLVGNKVIAWGEVVAVDGNYGLRITSLASRKERLESLRK